MQGDGPSPRFSFGFTAVEDRIFLFGGFELFSGNLQIDRNIPSPRLQDWNKKSSFDCSNLETSSFDCRLSQ